MRAIVLGALALAGCGQRFELPPQPESGRIPIPGTYNLDRIWEVPSPSDLVVHGSYVYVIQEEANLEVYLRRHPEPVRPAFVGTFEGLVHPVQVCLAKRDSTFILIADAGDMQIKRYYFRGGQPLHTFTDSAWVDLSGIAADEHLNVYVADAVRDTIYKYDEHGRRVRLIADRGTGKGFVIAPQGLAYRNKVLWVADTGKNWVQRLRPDSTNTAIEGQPIGLDVELGEPVDVAADPAGESVFVAEAANDRVLRFQATGGFQDTVYAHTKREVHVEPPVSSPRYVAADDSLVFLPDPENNRIVILRLATP